MLYFLSYGYYKGLKMQVTFSLTQGHWQSYYSIGHTDFLLVFHSKYVSILHHFLDIIDYFPKFKEVMLP